MHTFLRHKVGPVSKLAHCSNTATRSSSQALRTHAAQHTTVGIARQVLCRANVSLEDVQRDAEAGPSLSSINKLDLSSAMMLANLIRPPKDQVGEESSDMM